ncbi:MAG TPA: hypothetical protein VKK79_06375 [Candidatus Lokiarchaeia archaeon]|nr:hypothetical protein [Candidatus Lokiarchaeia archaeon]
MVPSNAQFMCPVCHEKRKTIDLEDTFLKLDCGHTVHGEESIWDCLPSRPLVPLGSSYP